MVVYHQSSSTHFSIWPNKVQFGRQIYHTFSMGGSLTVCVNVAISNKYPTNFEYHNYTCSNFRMENSLKEDGYQRFWE